jgi:hypothetical protein
MTRFKVGALAGCVALVAALGGASYAAVASPDKVANPRRGEWRAYGVSVKRVGAGWADPPGTTFARAWRIGGTCSAAACHLVLSRQTSEGLRKAKLVHVKGRTWRTRQVVNQVCDTNASTGQKIAGPETLTFVLRFSADGRHVTADERKEFKAPCTPRYATSRWAAAWVNAYDGPVV